MIFPQRSQLRAQLHHSKYGRVRALHKDTRKRSLNKTWTKRDRSWGLGDTESTQRPLESSAVAACLEDWGMRKGHLAGHKVHLVPRLIRERNGHCLR